MVPVESHNPELLRKVQSDDVLDAAASGNRVDDPIITDNTVMTRAEKLILGAGVLCACSEMQGQSAAGGPTRSQRFRVRGMEAAVRGEFEPRPPAKSQERCQAFLVASAKSDESLQMVRQQRVD